MSGDNLSGFFSGVVATWEWFERVCVGLWTGLGWPHSTFMMFLLAVYLFKNEIKNVIPRITKFGASGLELESPPPQTQPSVNAGELKESSVGEFPHSYGIVLAVVTKKLEEINDQERFNYLLSDDVRWRVLWYFENIYSFIFGGQIRFLELLNQRGMTGVSSSEAKQKWEEYKEINKPHMDDWEMQPYLNFLIVKELIVVEGEWFKITTTGNEFLVWMAKNGRSSNLLW